MDTGNLPLIKKCMELSSEFEKNGDTVNAEKWFNLGMKAEEYYAKQQNKTASEYYGFYKGEN